MPKFNKEKMYDLLTSLTGIGIAALAGGSQAYAMSQGQKGNWIVIAGGALAGIQGVLTNKK